MESSQRGPALGRRQLLVAAGAAAACISCSVAVDDISGQVDTTAVTGGAGNTAVGFGQRINLGSVADVLAAIRKNNGFWYRPDGRMWLTDYPAASLPQARELYSAAEIVGMEAGFVALFQKCPHLGCRVPNCETSQWFECPCHDAKFNRVGEHRSGPSPRGLDRFGVSITSDGNVIVDTGTIIQGPPIDTDTTGQQPAGPFCIGEASH